MESAEYKYRIDSVKQKWAYLKERQARGDDLLPEELYEMEKLRKLIMKFV